MSVTVTRIAVKIVAKTDKLHVFRITSREESMNWLELHFRGALSLDSSSTSSVES